MEEIRNDVIDEVTKNTEFENEVVEDFEEFEEPKKKSIIDKAKDFGSGAINKVKETGKWIKENPSEAAETAAGIATVAGFGLLTILGIQGAKKAERMDYSDEIGESFELKRKLKNKDIVELDYRKKTGQTKIEALNDMNLIK